MERYGKIPDKYTKEWWDYIWYYYKWHIIGTAAAVILTIVTVVQCAVKIHYDAEICYLGNVQYSDENIIEQMCADLGDVVSDVNANGKNQVYFNQIFIVKNVSDTSVTEYNDAMLTKAELELQTGESYLYFFSYEELNRVTERMVGNIFINPHEFAENVPDNNIYTDTSGVPCAVKLDENNEFLKKYNFTAEPIYIAIRNMRENDKKKEQEQAKYKNAFAIANYILNFN